MRRRYRFVSENIFGEIALLLIIIGIGTYMIFDLYFRGPASPSVDLPVESQSVAVESLNVDRFDILLLGLDGREGLNDRSDTIILLSIDVKKRKAQLLSIPRDTRVRLRGRWDKINAAYAYGGVDLARQTVTEFLGVDIDCYVVINFKSLVKLVDQVKGIDVYVPTRMYRPTEGIDLQPGYQHLDGEQVLAYTRCRDTKYGDLDRARRQQEVLQLLAAKVLEGRSFAQIVDYVNFARSEVVTDLSVREMVSLALMASPILENEVSAKILPGRSRIINKIWFYEADLTDLTEILAIAPAKIRTNS